MSFRKLLGALMLLLLGMSTRGQMVQPVKWSFSSRQVSEIMMELVFSAKIDAGWHIYGQSIPEGGPVATEFAFEPSVGVNLVKGVVPEKPAEKVFDKVFGMEIELYEGRVTFTQRVLVSVLQDTVRGTVTFMACNDHQCVAPEEVEFTIPVKGKVIASSVRETKPLQTKAEQPAVAGSKGLVPEPVLAEENIHRASSTVGIDLASVSEPIGHRSLWGLFIAGLLGGLAAFFMPCIFPLLPLTVSYFTKVGHKGSAFGQAALYGGSIIVIYVVLGLLVTLVFGADALNSLSTNGVFNFFFFLLLLVFAFSFLGAFELTLPASWGSKLDSKVDNGGVLGIFFMAATLAVVSFSCTGPIIGTLLVEAATTGELLGPAVGMLGFSISLALPFTLFSLFPKWLQSMPKSGGWLNSVKVTLGFLELALAMKFLSNVDLAYHWEWFDREIFLVVWIAISGLLSMYLLGRLKMPHDSEIRHVGTFRLSLAIVAIAFTLYMIPGLWGAPLKAISAFLPPVQTQDFDLYSSSLLSGSKEPYIRSNTTPRKYGDIFKAPYGINAFFDFEEGVAYAKQVGKPVLIDFTGHACVNCRQMEGSVWPNSEVLDRLRNRYVLIQLFVDDKTLLAESEHYTSSFSGKRIKTIGGKWSDLQAQRFNSNSQPFYVLLGSQGELLTQPKGAEYNVAKFVEFLDRGLETSELGAKAVGTLSH